MKAMEVGRVYWVAGKGVMKIEELPDPGKGKTTITMLQPSGFTYWADESELMETTPEVVSFYISELRRSFGDAPLEKISVIETWLKEMKGEASHGIQP